MYYRETLCMILVWYGTFLQWLLYSVHEVGCVVQLCFAGDTLLCSCDVYML